MGKHEVTIRVADLKRSRALYRRLGFVELDNHDVHDCRLRHDDEPLVLTDRPAEAAHPQRQVLAPNGPRSGGVVLTVFVRDLDEVLAYWQEEGMLVLSRLHQGSNARVFHGLDYDGNELRIQERGPHSS